MRWVLRNYSRTVLLSGDLSLLLEMAENLILKDYRNALVKRDRMRSGLASVSPLADAMNTFSSTGHLPPQHHYEESGEAQYAFKRGHPAFNVATSALGTPSVTLPLIGFDGTTTGIQLIGALHSEWTLTGYAKWMKQSQVSVSL